MWGTDTAFSGEPPRIARGPPAATARTGGRRAAPRGSSGGLVPTKTRFRLRAPRRVGGYPTGLVEVHVIRSTLKSGLKKVLGLRQPEAAPPPAAPAWRAQAEAVPYPKQDAPAP